MKKADLARQVNDAKGLRYSFSDSFLNAMMRDTWFESLTGIPEETPDQVRSQLTLDGTEITSEANGRTMTCGRLRTPTLADLREQTPDGSPTSPLETGDRLPLREVVADVQELHVDPANAGALFQVASQFNLLEMTSPSVSPEDGIGIYSGDYTQGPACAIAAGAGTIYRNYFAEVQGQVGQSTECQINCLNEVGRALGNQDGELWKMRNGYALATRPGLKRIAEHLDSLDSEGLEGLRGKLKIGLQLGTEVTLQDAGHLVSQAYCSALPVSYSSHPTGLWEPFARFILEGAYEATLRAAHLNAERTGNNTVFLTLLGGGAFGNETDWILDSLERALHACAPLDLDVAVVSYGGANSNLHPLLDSED
jgi:hypothetical protein